MTALGRLLTSALAVLGLAASVRAQDPPAVYFLNKHGEYPVRFVARAPEGAFGWAWSEAGLAVKSYPGPWNPLPLSADVLKDGDQPLTLRLDASRLPKISVGPGNELWFVTDRQDMERGKVWAGFLDAAEAAYRHKTRLLAKGTVGQWGNCSVVSLPADPDQGWPADLSLKNATPNAKGPESYEPVDSPESSESVNVLRFLRWVESSDPRTPCTGNGDLMLFPIAPIARGQDGYFLTLSNAQASPVSFAELSPDSWEPGTRLRGETLSVDSSIEVELGQPEGDLDLCSITSLKPLCAAEEKLRRRMYVWSGDSETRTRLLKACSDMTRQDCASGPWGESVGPYNRFYRGPVKISENPPIESIVSDNGEVQWEVPWNGSSLEANLRLPGLESQTAISLRAPRLLSNDKVVGLVLLALALGTLVYARIQKRGGSLRFWRKKEPPQGDERDDPAGAKPGGDASSPKEGSSRKPPAVSGEGFQKRGGSLRFWRKKEPPQGDERDPAGALDRDKVEAILLAIAEDPKSILGILGKKLGELSDFERIRRDLEDSAKKSTEAIEEQSKAAQKSLSDAQQREFSTLSQELLRVALQGQEELEKKGRGIQESLLKKVGELPDFERIRRDLEDSAKKSTEAIEEQSKAAQKSLSDAQKREQEELEKKGRNIRERLLKIDDDFRDKLIQSSAPELEKLAKALMNERLRKDQGELKDHAKTVIEQEVGERWSPYFDLLQAIEPLLGVPGRLEALRGLLQLLEQNPAIASRLQKLSEILPVEGALFAFAPDHSELQAVSREEGHRYAADRYKSLVAEVSSLDKAERDRVSRGLEAAGRLGSWSQGLLRALEIFEAGALKKRLPGEAFEEWCGAVQTLHDFALHGGPVIRNLADRIRQGKVENRPEDGKLLRYAEGVFLERSGLLKNEKSSGTPFFKRLRSCLFPYNQVGRLSRVCLAAQFLIEAFPREHPEEAERKLFESTLRDHLRDRDLPEDFHVLIGDAATGCSLHYRPVPYYKARINEPGYEFIERSVSAIRLEQRAGRLPAEVDSWLVVRLRSPFLFEEGDIIYSGHAHVAHVRRQEDA